MKKILLTEEQFEWYTKHPKVSAKSNPYRRDMFQCTLLTTDTSKNIADFRHLGKNLDVWSKEHNHIFEGNSVVR